MNNISQEKIAKPLFNKRATASDDLTSVDELLQDESAKAGVKIFQGRLAAWDGPKNAARFLNEAFG